MESDCAGVAVRRDDHERHWLATIDESLAKLGQQAQALEIQRIGFLTFLRWKYQEPTPEPDSDGGQP